MRAGRGNLRPRDVHAPVRAASSGRICADRAPTGCQDPGRQGGAGRGARPSGHHVEDGLKGQRNFMAGRLDGTVAVITGGARGIGGATAVKFAAEGARVVIGDLLEAEASETLAAIRVGGGEAEFVKTDVTDEDQCRALCQTAVDRFGQLDVVVTGAGVLQGAVTAIEDLDVDTLTRD